MEERETRARWLRFVGASAALVAVLGMPAAAGGGVLADATVTASNYRFTAADVTITQGEAVTWANAGGTHDVVFADGFKQPSQPSPPGSAWPVSRTFNTPGTYSYYCSLHQDLGMVGTVTVDPAAPPPGGYPPPPPGGEPAPPGGAPSPGAPGTGKSATTVTLQVSDASPTRGARVRFFGTVKPEQDGRFLQLQRRVGGAFRTVLRIKLVDAGSTRSKFSKRLRVLGDAVFRARLPADSGHETGMSRARRLDVH